MTSYFRNKWLLALSSGIAFWLAWPPFSFAPFLLLVALIPLLQIAAMIEEERLSGQRKRIFLPVFSAFALWNILDTYWIWNASPVGAIIAVLLNGCLMSLPFIGYSYSLRFGKPILSALSLISYWIAYEYFHLHWDLSWPWLSLGNGWAEWPSIIQWYEYTGVFGGSLWILVTNILLFSYLKERTQKKLVYTLSIILIPISFSLIRFFTYTETETPCSVVVTQPNIDPYTEKFDGMATEDQLRRLIRLSDSVAKPNTEFILWPETALSESLWEENLNENTEIDTIRSFLSAFPHANLVTGAMTAKEYTMPNASPTARAFKNGNGYYDVYNSALQIENSGPIKIYHKSKLVPGVEAMPFPTLFKFLEPLALQLGGTSGSLGAQKERTVFYAQSGIGCAPVICYESIYGGYVSEYIRNGAQFIAIVTNDGWWGNTPGYHQHAAYARLRAIENRRSIARSANTGVSCFINQKGESIHVSNWDEATALENAINLNNTITFYTAHGDYIAYIGCALAFVLLFIQLFRKKSI